jgi:hypothetical protein
MRVGVYVDGYNLYYGGRKLCKRGTEGWRWLNIRSLAEALILEQREKWTEGSIARVVYCTARIQSGTNLSSAQDQDTYLKALGPNGAQSVDHIEYGNYISKVIKRPLAVEEGRKRTPRLVTPDWPIMVKSDGEPVTNANFLASVVTWEEKGSDVNVASHLLVDVLTNEVDAVIVISNDSDLRWPVEEVRRRVPVGLVNPGSGFTAGSLSADSSVGVGNHWWRTLGADDFLGHQLPNPAGSYVKPNGW